MKAVEAWPLVGGHVDGELLLRNEHLAAENEIPRSKLSGRVLLNDHERTRLAKLGKRLGAMALSSVAVFLHALYELAQIVRADGSGHIGIVTPPIVLSKVFPDFPGKVDHLRS